VLLVDTNIWLAAADRRSDRHEQCAALLRARRGELAAPVPVIAEASWLILDRLGTAAQAAYLRLITSGQLTPVDLTGPDWQRCADLAEQYASLRLDLIDASIVATAERLKLTTLATLNRRDFTVVRPRHAEAFELLP
jgi:predicted nucleic acid-binding protein